MSFSFRGSHFVLWLMKKHEKWVDKHKSLRQCIENPFERRTILIAVLLTIIERQFIVIFHNPFAFVSPGMFSDNKFLYRLFFGWENNCIEMWYIAIIICVQPQFAEMNNPEWQRWSLAAWRSQSVFSFEGLLGQLTNIKSMKKNALLTEQKENPVTTEN